MATNSYAIVESGGKQYRAEKGMKVVVDRLSADVGDKLTLRPLMFRGDKRVVVDGSELEKVKVEAVVSEHLRGPKVRVFKYKPKKGYRRRAGHRQELTELEVTDVRMLSRKPAAKKPAAKKPAARKRAVKKPSTKAKAPAKKAPAKKPAARKPAARRSSSAKKS
jgi:large subunit ribosomal protein L21